MEQKGVSHLWGGRYPKFGYLNEAESKHITFLSVQ